jgi:hypothetical protein
MKSLRIFLIGKLILLWWFLLFPLKFFRKNSSYYLYMRIADGIEGIGKLDILTKEDLEFIKGD